ncbi:MAG: acetylornithine deacetylase [Gammaproteobacteria bacterium]|nr:acetylornithine deacetylase [Gammaproteobacteria bacterium]
MNTIDWLKKLISFNTISSLSNLELIAAIEAWLSKYHIQSSLTYDDSKIKANLFATLPAKNGNLNGGLILSGHTDVVPVEGQSWETDPFDAFISNNRVYGRGTSDMKGFIAVVLALLPEFCQLSLNKPLHLCFSYDEEVGCLGAPKIIADMQQRGISPDACIVGEPSKMKAVIAHKGINVFRCRIHGLATHSSLTPQGCNAIEYAAQFIHWIKQYAIELQNAEQDLFYDVSHTTITTNMISGGTAVNIIPSYCEFYFEFRNLPCMNAQIIIDKIKLYAENELTPQMQKNTPDAYITIESIGSVPAHEVSESASITQHVQTLINDVSINKVSYATEAGLFQKANIPTIICGPGSIEQAHQANEYIELSQLIEAENFLRKLVKKLC